jgi:hypothetical protein
MKQLLTTLTNALRKSRGDKLDIRKQAILRPLLSGLTTHGESQKAKSCAQLLGSLLSREVVGIQELLNMYSEQPEAGRATNNRVLFQQFLRELFQWLSDGDFGATVAQLASTLVDKYESVDDEPNPNPTEVLWSGPLNDALICGTVKTDDLKAHILPVLFKRRFSDFVLFLESHGLRSLWNDIRLAESKSASMDRKDEHDLLYAALQAGKEIGFLCETEHDQVIQTQTTFSIPVDIMGRLLVRSSRNARITGLTCLITSHTATRPFSLMALGLIKRHIGNFFADPDADFRSVVFSMFQKLIDRIRAITAALSRQASPKVLAPNMKVSPNEVLQSHREFVRWFSVFLTRDLRPTASYQRHISALKCLSILARSGVDTGLPSGLLSKSALGETKWPFSMTIFSKDLRRRLIDLLLDPFEDVRQTASSILGLNCAMQADNPSQDFRQEVESVLSRAETTMLLTGRADHADGVAHLYGLKARCGRSRFSDQVSDTAPAQAVLQSLIRQLNEMLLSARQDLAQAVARYPLHGILTSLRYVLVQSSASEMTEFCVQVQDPMSQVWEVVKPILCNDAPEGYLPEDFEESIDSSKQTLSYCWRALKEASLLMGTLISLVQDDMLLERMAQLCFTQLAELRHRGAFSTVAQTWASICIRCSAINSSNGISLLEKWYGDILGMLRNNITINTRRSAGLPSLLCGILIADTSRSFIHRAFTDLQTIAKAPVIAAADEEGSLAQVHAMNCIKDIMKNTRLGEHSERHISPTMRLAATALQSSVWAIRNCGLMLFRAVIDRLLGTSEAHLDESTELAKQIFLAEQPEVLAVLMGILHDSAEGIDQGSSRYEGVFPSLQLVQQSRLPEDARNQIKDDVVALTASPRWHVRDKAARTYASLVDLSEAALESVVLIETGTSSHNAFHGRLLAARYIMAQLSLALRKDSSNSGTTIPSIPKFVRNDLDYLYELASRSYKTATCGSIQAASIDLLRELLRVSIVLHQDITTTALPVHTNVVKFIDIAKELASETLKAASAAGVRQALARFAAVQVCYTAVNVSQLCNAVIELTKHDQDAVAYFLEAVKEFLSSPDVKNAEYIVQICGQILGGSSTNNLKCAAQEVLLHPYLCETSPDALALISGLSSQNVLPTQRFADQELELRTIRLNLVPSNTTVDSSGHTLHSVRLWADDCNHAVAGNGVHSRQAAALALQRVGRGWILLSSEPSLDTHFRHLCLAIYDLLNDDDEDVRIAASRTAVQILLTTDTQTQNVSDLEPITASQRLLSFLIRRWARSQDFFREAFTRVFVNLEPVTEQITRHSQTDQALFVEEKQNLYIDDAREIAVWSQVVMKLSWPEAVDQTLAKGLGAWAEQGIPSLRRDGTALVAKAETFTLGLSVIYGAEILLRLSAAGISPVRPSEIRATLISWISELDKSGDAGTWRSELERVLQQSLRLKLGKLNSVLEDVLAQHEPTI